MNDPQWPAIPIPLDLSDKAAAQLLDFVYDLAAAIEQAYAGQLHRYYNPERDEPISTNIADELDPPF